MKRARILLKGIVQGVGFRPFVYNLATSLSLKGFVLNTEKGVEVEVEGEDKDVDAFISYLDTPPPLARIESKEVVFLEPKGYQLFEIKFSRKTGQAFTFVSPDIATCRDCLKEVFDPSDRRYLYPFTNCTNCGPRFTIIKGIPYDRRNTTMGVFEMCPECRREYEDPRDRRFHAQPNACPLCGPRAELVSREGERVPGDPLKNTGRFLREGYIVAIKGLGGFHLACNAWDDGAVLELRRRKKRDHKPFAVMCRDIGVVEKIACLDDESGKLLESSEAPIVILPKKKGPSEFISPGRKDIGVMLPYTPLHHIIFRYSPDLLVMTSGNLTDEPIVFKNEEALERLGNVADFFLVHNRDIYIRCDDSVLKRWGKGFIFFRRSRGYTPRPIRIGKGGKSILALGGHLKNTFCVVKNGYAFLSHHIGDLDNPRALSSFEEGIEHFKKILDFEPELVVCDLHPDYASTRFAEELGLPLLKVQHHFAHALSCLAERELRERVIAVVMDGAGYGTDGTVWGGELLVAWPQGFKRLGHLRYIGMPGGEAASREGWRMALSYLHRIFGDPFSLDLPFLKDLDEKKCRLIIKALDLGINSPKTSSIGRLFDAISAILSIRSSSTYEGQAASELEQVAERGERESYHFSRVEGEVTIWDPDPILEGIVEDLRRGVSPGVISAKFHNTLSQMILDMALFARDMEGIDKVCLSGGVFQNALLLEKATFLLEGEGFEVLLNEKVPPNDGGISLGQAFHGLFRGD